MRVIFSDRAYTAVLAETAEKITTETGGLFLGVVEEDTWYIIEAIDPGPKAVFELAYFEYDKAYSRHLMGKVANLYLAQLDLIGLWHRHPGSLDRFSFVDDETNAKFAARRDCGAISALVNVDPDFRMTMYHVAQPCRYSKIECLVGNDLIPHKFMELRGEKSFTNLMKRSLDPERKHAAERKCSVSLAGFLKALLPAMEDCKKPEHYDVQINRDDTAIECILDSLMDDLMFLSDVVGIVYTMTAEDGRLILTQETPGELTRAAFCYAEDKEQVYFDYRGSRYAYKKDLFRVMHEKT